MRYCLSCVLLATLLTVSAASAASTVAPRKKVSVYTSQGEATYRHEERSKSQKQAVQAFLAHGVAQALSSVSGSTRTGEASRIVHDRILKQPERYVESYRINSEGPLRGVYRVSGLVTVNVDALREAIKKEMSAQAIKPSPSTTVTPKQPSDAAKSGSSPPLAAKTKPQDQPTPAPAHEVVPAKPSLFWAVPEKWEEDWIVPGKHNGERSPFSRFLLQETEDLDWTLAFPGEGALSPDSEGGLTADRVTALAKQAGCPLAVVGTASATSPREQAGEVTLSSDLQLVQVSSGKLLGNVHKEALAEPGSIQEAIMGLAGQAASQLDRVVRREQVGSPRAQEPPGGSTPPPPPNGAWTLDIRGEGHYAAWEALLNTLRKRFPDLHITSVDVDGSKTKVVIEGIDGGFFSSAQEAATLRGLKLGVDSPSSGSRQIELSVRNQDSPGLATEPQP